MRKKILITYEYFFPAYKAGGPIQSIANLCRQLKTEYEFFIVCGDKDHNEKSSLPLIKADTWNDFENNTAKVYYVGYHNRKVATIKKIMNEIQPDVVLVNGLFSPLFSIAPLFFTKNKRVISVRGMLHPGALTQKANKKRVFIFLLKALKVANKAVFHATDEKEAQYIKAIFSKAKIVIAQNFSNVFYSAVKKEKKESVLYLISIALVSPMKNHHLILQALKNVKSQVFYTIYGPVKDEQYWMKCSEFIKELPPNISVEYKGPLEPASISSVLGNHDVFILPSKSENFGHAHYEALACGLPLITSYFTPWNNLSDNKAGWNVDIENLSSISSSIEKAALLDNVTYQIWSGSAKEYASKRFDRKKIQSQYQMLFEN